MLFRAAEECFDKGLKALGRRRHREALAMFEAALELERKLGTDRPQSRYLSYYGLVLALEMQQLHEGLRFCREAAAHEDFNADVHCNLGRVLMFAGRRREAHGHLVRGLVLQPNHRGIITELRRMGMRRKPVVPFLGRNNPLNVFLGRVVRKAS